MLSNKNTGYPRRRQKRDAQTNYPRTSDYAQLSVEIYCQLLWRILEQQQRCHHVHGIHGRRVSFQTGPLSCMRF